MYHLVVDVHHKRKELNSTTLSVGNRVCFNCNGYDPEACDVCSTNRDKWTDCKDEELVEGWRLVLKAHQKNSSKPWVYGNVFHDFFRKNKGPITIRDNRSSRSRSATPASSSSTIQSTPSGLINTNTGEKSINC